MGYSDLRPVCVNALGSIYGGARVAVRGGPRERSEMSFFFTGNLNPEEEEDGMKTPEGNITYTMPQEKDLLQPYVNQYLREGDMKALLNHIVIEGLFKGKLSALVDGDLKKLNAKIIAQANVQKERAQNEYAAKNNFAPGRRTRPTPSFAESEELPNSAAVLYPYDFP